MAEFNSRAAAARVLAEVIGQGRSLSTALPRQLAGISSAQDRGFVQELCFGTLRWLPRLELMLRPLLRNPLKQRDSDVQALLLIGLYQLLYLDTPPHAAVSETVSATGVLSKPWARGLVNGVLRNFQRRQAELTATAEGSEVGRYAHPQWLIKKLRKAWPDRWEAIVEANNRRAPMTLRVNRQRISRDEYLKSLSEAGIAARPAAHVSQGIILETPVAVQQLPGFADGLVSVQDAAAQLAAELMGPRPGERILDACAAPGGKTGHLLELAANLEVVAVEQDPARLEKITENLDRLGGRATLVQADAAATGQWWDGRPFDRILLDAPCSATGVIRRHPDIKVLRRPGDIDELAQLQQRLLGALWPLLKPGGMLVYATCSVLPQENELQIRRFSGDHTDAVPVEISGTWGQPGEFGRQILPGEDEMDGFYYARLAKQ
jgi:16S rRNA (cytosine967-C5)-methyltransferase